MDKACSGGTAVIPPRKRKLGRAVPAKGKRSRRMIGESRGEGRACREESKAALPRRKPAHRHGRGSSATALAGLASLHSAWCDTGGRKLRAPDSRRRQNPPCLPGAKRPACRECPRFCARILFDHAASGMRPELATQNHPRAKNAQSRDFGAARCSTRKVRSFGAVPALQSLPGGGAAFDVRGRAAAWRTASICAFRCLRQAPCLAAGRREEVPPPRL